MNVVHILGRLGKDPETRTFEGGNSVTNITVATDESYRDKQGNKVEKTEWHSIQFFGKQGEVIAQYLEKGNRIQVTGKLQTRSYQDKEGATRYVTEIIGSRFEFIDSKPKESQSENPPIETTPLPDGDDDLPF